MSPDEWLTSTPKRVAVVVFQECPVEECDHDESVRRWKGADEVWAVAASRAADLLEKDLLAHLETVHGGELEMEM